MLNAGVNIQESFSFVKESSDRTAAFFVSTALKKYAMLPIYFIGVHMDNEEFNMEVEMERLHLNSFLHVAADSESARYRILAGLNTCRHELNHNRLFPAISELIELNTGLCTLLEQHEEFIRDLHRDIESSTAKTG